MSIQERKPSTSRLLVLRVDSQQLWEFTVESVITIGRSSANDIQLTHPQVSRSHCALFHSGIQWECSSLSANGFFIEGERVFHVVVANGLIIQLGRSGPELRLCLPVTSTDAAPPTDDDSVTHWLHELKLGSATATRKIWGYYFDQVVDLARRRLGNTPRRVADEEDVALSVFNRLFIGVSGGQYPQLSDRDGLWRLLVIMTSRRSIDQIQHARRQKRGAGLIRGDSGIYSAVDGDSPDVGFDQFEGDEPTPEYIAMMAEETTRYLALLDDETLQRIALWKLEGYTNQEIADKLSLNVRTVERKLRSIRQCWSSLLDNLERTPNSGETAR